MNIFLVSFLLCDGKLNVFGTEDETLTDRSTGNILTSCSPDEGNETDLYNSSNKRTFISTMHVVSCSPGAGGDRSAFQTSKRCETSGYLDILQPCLMQQIQVYCAL